MGACGVWVCLMAVKVCRMWGCGAWSAGRDRCAYGCWWVGGSVVWVWEIGVMVGSCGWCLGCGCVRSG